MSRSRGRSGRVAALVGCIMLGLLGGVTIAELAVRAFPPRDIVLLSLPAENFEISDVPGIPYLPRRNMPGWTNALGLRSSKDTSVAKTPGVFRLLVVGDSVTGSATDCSSPQCLYPDVLEGLLTDRLDKPIEVLNLSSPGLSMHQEITLVRARGLPLHPDLVLVGYARNDPVPTDILAAPNVELWKGLRVLQLAQLWYGRRPLGNHEDWYREGSEVYQQLERTFAEMTRLGTELPLVLVPLPVLRLEESEQIHLPAVARLCRTNGLRCLDIYPQLLPYIRSVAPRRDDLHFDTAGHRAVAEALAVPLAKIVTEGSGT